MKSEFASGKPKRNRPISAKQHSAAKRKREEHAAVRLQAIVRGRNVRSDAVAAAKAGVGTNPDLASGPVPAGVHARAPGIVPFQQRQTVIKVNPLERILGLETSGQRQHRDQEARMRDHLLLGRITFDKYHVLLLALRHGLMTWEQVNRELREEKWGDDNTNTVAHADVEKEDHLYSSSQKSRAVRSSRPAMPSLSPTRNSHLTTLATQAPMVVQQYGAKAKNRLICLAADSQRSKEDAVRDTLRRQVDTLVIRVCLLCARYCKKLTQQQCKEFQSEASSFTDATIASCGSSVDFPPVSSTWISQNSTERTAISRKEAADGVLALFRQIEGQHIAHPHKWLINGESGEAGETHDAKLARQKKEMKVLEAARSLLFDQLLSRFEASCGHHICELWPTRCMPRCQFTAKGPMYWFAQRYKVEETTDANEHAGTSQADHTVLPAAIKEGKQNEGDSSDNFGSNSDRKSADDDDKLLNFGQWPLPCSFPAPATGDTAGALPTLPERILLDPSKHLVRTKGNDKFRERQKDMENKMLAMTIPRFAKRFRLLQNKSKREMAALALAQQQQQHQMDKAQNVNKHRLQSSRSRRAPWGSNTPSSMQRGRGLESSGQQSHGGAINRINGRGSVAQLIRKGSVQTKSIFHHRPSIVIDEENSPLTDEQVELVASMEYHLQLLLQRSEISNGAYERLMGEIDKVLPVSSEKRRARVRRLRNYIRQGQQKRDERLFDELLERNADMAKDLEGEYWERNVVQRNTADENINVDLINNEGEEKGGQQALGEEPTGGESGDGNSGGSYQQNTVVGGNSGLTREASRTVTGAEIASIAAAATKEFAKKNGKLRRMNTITAREMRQMQRQAAHGHRNTAAKVGYEIVNTKAELDKSDPNHPQNLGRAIVQAVPLGHEEHAAQEKAKAQQEWDKEQAAMIEQQHAVRIWCLQFVELPTAPILMSEAR